MHFRPQRNFSGYIAALHAREGPTPSPLQLLVLEPTILTTRRLRDKSHFPRQALKADPISPLLMALDFRGSDAHGVTFEPRFFAILPLSAARLR